MRFLTPMHLLKPLLLALAATGVALAQTTVTPADLLAHGATYDGQHVSVTGTAAHVTHKTSHRGNAYTTYDLCSGAGCIHVFSFGSANVQDGASVTVAGTYSVEKHVGSDVYHDELDVDEP